ncbi:hypothetical protein AB0383_20325 [Amycolatopsis sp. NPDC051373]|uniref:hypothetical protein n=1 Tax=Amycolatopsis sp. NPDC051373 TaxID=3155801 RepID=UPI00344FD12B
MILWVILGITALVSVVGMVLTAANPEYAALIRKAKVRHNPAGMALISLLMFAIPCLWVWYSVQTGDWRFAAIFCVPLVFRGVFKLVNPKR